MTNPERKAASDERDGLLDWLDAMSPRYAICGEIADLLRADATLQQRCEALELDVETLRELANTGRDCITLRAQLSEAQATIEALRKDAEKPGVAMLVSRSDWDRWVTTQTLGAWQTLTERAQMPQCNLLSEPVIELYALARSTPAQGKL